jgi:carbon-monoxide dehydrogenase medium subunit
LREAASISVASTAAVVEIHDEICSDVCIVIGAVAPTPKMSDKAIAILKGKKISELSEDSSILIQAGKAAADEALPIDDLRGSATYRRNIIKVLARRAVLKATLRAKSLS